MNLRDLKYFVNLAETRHFGRAAEISHVSQPTLSMQLKKLEDELGVSLFERNNRNVMLTPVGEKILYQARDLLGMAQRIRDTARQHSNPFGGELRLGAFPTLAPYLLPQITPRITETYPDLTLLLVEEKTDQLLHALAEGKLDAALVALPAADARLEAIPLFDEPFLLAVPQGHALNTRKFIEQKDLQSHRLLLLDEGHCLRDQALSVCALAGTAEHQDFRATSMETLKQMVANGVGITLVPAMAAQPHPNIRYIPFTAPAPSRSIGLVHRRTTPRLPLLKALAELIARQHTA